VVSLHHEADAPLSLHRTVRQRPLAVTPREPDAPMPRFAAESSLPGLFDCLWDWTRDLDPGQSAPVPASQGSVLHVERADSGLRLTLVGGHRTIVYRWTDRANMPHLVAPFGLPPSVEVPAVWRSALHHHVELHPGRAVFQVQVPCI
jgi:hypothetical protein